MKLIDTSSKIPNAPSHVKYPIQNAEDRFTHNPNKEILLNTRLPIVAAKVVTTGNSGRGELFKVIKFALFSYWKTGSANCFAFGIF